MRNISVFGRVVAVSALAVGVSLAGVGDENLSLGFVTAAQAQGKKADAPGNQGGQGQGSQGSQSGQDNSGGTGTGQGGPGEDSDGKGPRVGGPSSDGSGGGKPNWAAEGIPEVELGRLSVARSPDRVLDRSLAEAIATWELEPSPITQEFYTQSLAGMLDDLENNWDGITIYDSPLQNLALFKDVLEDGVSDLPGVENDPETLLAVFLGVASDKTVPISEDTVTAMLVILSDGLPSVIDVDVASVAADAEAIREAVLLGHG
jgi:hypothetical protein